MNPLQPLPPEAPLSEGSPDDLKAVLRASIPTFAPALISSPPIPSRIAAVPYEPPLMLQMQREPRPRALKLAPPPNDAGPLQPVAIPGSNDVRVFGGFVAGLLPAGMSYGDDPPFLLEGLSGSGVIYVKVTTDSAGEPTGAEILSDTALPDDDDTHGHYPLGSFTVVDGIIAVPESSSGNLNYIRCPNWYSNPRTYTHTWSREGGS